MNADRRSRSGLAGAGALAIGAAILFTPLNAILSRPMVDWQLRRLAPAGAPEGVVVVDIDDPSIARLQDRFGTWPYRRDVYALAVETLRDLGASAIVFDLVFADALPGDEALARTMARPGAPVVLAAAGLRHRSDERASETAWARPGGALEALRASGSATPAYGWPAIALPSTSVRPDATSPPALGVITTPVDDDGILRGVPLWHESGGQRWPWSALALLDRVAPSSMGSMPSDPSGLLRVAFAGPSAAPATVAFWEVIGEAGADPRRSSLRRLIDGRVVFVGSSALLADAVMTVQGQSTGTSALVQTYVAMRDRTWVRPPSRWADGLLIAFAWLPLSPMARRGRAARRRDTVWTVGAALGAAAFAAVCLLVLRLPTSWAAALATALIGFALATALQFQARALERRRLAHALTVADERARARSEFVAQVSHEIRTPLNALLGVAELLADSDLAPAQRRQVRLFQEAGGTLRRLVDDLLDLSRLEAGGFAIERTPFSLREVVGAVVDLLATRAQARQLDLALEWRADAPDRVVGDPKRLEQVLYNLVGNALKYTQRGRVTVSVATDATPATGVVIEVADTGIGIPTDELDRIFEPFARARTATDGAVGGTGLGLAIARRIVQRMGGSIQVRSQAGQGSRFTLRLPLPPSGAVASPPARVGSGGAADAPIADDTPASPAAGPRDPVGRDGTADPGRLRVLLAEDDEANAYVFEALLQRSGPGIRVDVAIDGQAALDALLDHRYQIAFVDLQMPRLDGLAVTREFRRREASNRWPRTPIVALSGNALPEDVAACLAAGCDRHIAKPFEKAQILAAIADLVPAARDRS
ncbi:MAG: ATP-binding protein [Burkholderiales bacterium]